MALRMVNKGNGLIERVAQAGFYLALLDGQWTTDNEDGTQPIIDGYTLDDCKEYHCLQVELHAKTLRDAAMKDVSPAEMASWPLKLRQADKYTASQNPADAPLLAAEVQVRGVTLDALVAKVYAYAEMASMLEAAISGTCGKHKDAIRACADFDEVIRYNYMADWPPVA